MEKANRFIATHVCAQWLFLRALGVVYVIAFLSLGLQIDGLIGSNGILPASHYLDAASAAYPGAAHVFRLPTLAWLNSSDLFLQFLCWGGLLAGLGIVFSFATAPLLVVAWLFYLSLVNVGQDFLSFQWDILLLEAGFLSIFWAPWQLIGPPWKCKLQLEPEPVTFKVILWLFRWLLFRLMFLSGAVKILSGDTTWRNFTALKFHYETQPLPTPLAWLANQLPDWFQIASVAGVFFIELAVPFLFFGPRKVRYVAAALTVALQIMILLTGNYTFFNWLTIAICITLVDDAAIKRLLPDRIRRMLIAESVDESAQPQSGKVKSVARKAVISGVSALVVLASIAQLDAGLVGTNALSNTAAEALDYVGRFHIVNTYGLFAVMTTSRPEISVEGSNDGANWLPYVFRYKPGPLDRPPPIIAPLQPRLDWQMWFAALGTLDDNRWFLHFAYKLLQGAPPVVQLLEKDPFSGTPPRFVRANVQQYHFTNFQEFASTGHWWKRDPESVVYMPAVSLDNFR